MSSNFNHIQLFFFRENMGELDPLRGRLSGYLTEIADNIHSIQVIIFSMKLRVNRGTSGISLKIYIPYNYILKRGRRQFRMDGQLA